MGILDDELPTLIIATVTVKKHTIFCTDDDDISKIFGWGKAVIQTMMMYRHSQ